MKTDVNVIIFDLDGVIINSATDIANAVLYALKYFNRPLLPKDEIISYVGRGAENLVRKSFKECGDDIIRKAMPIYLDYYLNNCIVETRLYSHVQETLEYLKDKKIALVTNKPEDLSRKILAGLKVNEYFDLVVGPESVKKMKPDPEGLLKVLAAFDEHTGKAIMVGDSYTDVEAGKKAGIYTCGAAYGLGSVDELIKSSPDFVISDIIELTDILK